MSKAQRYDQWQIREDLVSNNGEEFLNSVLETVEDQEKATRNVKVMLTSAAINNRISEVSDQVGIDINVFDDRATAVLALVQDEKGPEAYGKMPGGDYGIHDIDKYFFPDSQNEISMERLWEEAYSVDATGFEQSSNQQNLKHPKYTAHIHGPTSEIECDLVRPEINEFDGSETVQITGDLSVTVPNLSEVIRTKGTIEFDNGYGYDSFRQKDGEELLALLSVAEDRGISPQELREGWNMSEMVTLGRRIDQIYPTVHDSVESMDEYVPTTEYADTIISWTEYESRL